MEIEISHRGVEFQKANRRQKVDERYKGRASERCGDNVRSMSSADRGT